MPKRYGKRKQTPNLEQTQLYDKVTKLESSILSDLQYLNKRKNMKFECVHCYEEQVEEYDASKNYYDEFWKAYMINVVVMRRYEEYREWMRKVSKKMGNIEMVYKERKEVMEPIESKRRRKVSDSQVCGFECGECGKRYRDGDSLEIHMSIKHRKEQLKLEAKYEQINGPFMDNSESDRNYYEDD